MGFLKPVSTEHPGSSRLERLGCRRGVGKVRLASGSGFWGAGVRLWRFTKTEAFVRAFSDFQIRCTRTN